MWKEISPDFIKCNFISCNGKERDNLVIKYETSILK